MLNQTRHKIASVLTRVNNSVSSLGQERDSQNRLILVTTKKAAGLRLLKSLQLVAGLS
jgi:hypothetical protein